MNTWTKFYGIIGLVSTMGKNGFDFNARVSKLSEKTCYYAEKAFEKLKEASTKAKENWAWTAQKNEEAKESCQDWEKWAEQKWEEAKQQEELNEDWNNLHGVHFYARTLRAEERQNNLWKNNPERRYTLPRQEKISRPSCLRNILSLY